MYKNASLVDNTAEKGISINQMIMVTWLGMMLATSDLFGPISKAVGSDVLAFFAQMGIAGVFNLLLWVALATCALIAGYLYSSINRLRHR